MKSPTAVIVPTGTANIASVRLGLHRAGAQPVVLQNVEDIDTAPLVVLPGVGSFGMTMQRLETCGLAQALHDRAQHDLPLLAICVGLQVLCRSSDETPGAVGLGVLDTTVERFPDGATLRVPQMGWNHIEADANVQLVRSGFGYFANSYCVVTPPDGCAIAWSDHGGRFVAAIERGALLACQFHPELSGAWGVELLARWVQRFGGCSC